MYIHISKCVAPAKAALWGKCIVSKFLYWKWAVFLISNAHIYFRKQKEEQIKSKRSSSNGKIKINARINKIDDRKTTEKINEAKVSFSWEIGRDVWVQQELAGGKGIFCGSRGRQFGSGTFYDGQMNQAEEAPPMLGWRGTPPVLSSACGHGGDELWVCFWSFA